MEIFLYLIGILWLVNNMWYPALCMIIVLMISFE